MDWNHFNNYFAGVPNLSMLAWLASFISLYHPLTDPEMIDSMGAKSGLLPAECKFCPEVINSATNLFKVIFTSHQTKKANLTGVMALVMSHGALLNIQLSKIGKLIAPHKSCHSSGWSKSGNASWCDSISFLVLLLQHLLFHGVGKFNHGLGWCAIWAPLFIL